MSAINSTLAAPLAPQPIKNRFNEMSSEEFMKIIFTELQQQDVVAIAVTNHFCQDGSTTTERMLEFFEDDGSCAL